MLNKHDLIFKISRTLIKDLEILNEDFEAVDFSDTYFEKQYQILMNRYDSRIFFDREPSDLEVSEFDQICLEIIKLIAILVEEKDQKGIRYLLVKKQVEKYLKKSKLPQWLYQNLLNHIPPLYFRDLEIDKQEDANMSDEATYIIFLKNQKIIECDKEGLDKFHQDTDCRKFDIYIERLETSKILINNKAKVFRAGRYQPFSILSYLLQRSGDKVNYNEIYVHVIKPLEKKHPRDRSKKIYDYLKYLNLKIAKVTTAKQKSDQWFKRDYNQGIINVSTRLNGCLITTPQNITN